MGLLSLSTSQRRFPETTAVAKGLDLSAVTWPTYHSNISNNNCVDWVSMGIGYGNKGFKQLVHESVLSHMKVMCFYWLFASESHQGPSSLEPLWLGFLKLMCVLQFKRLSDGKDLFLKQSFPVSTLLWGEVWLRRLGMVAVHGGFDSNSDVWVLFNMKYIWKVQNMTLLCNEVRYNWLYWPRFPHNMLPYM